MERVGACREAHTRTKTGPAAVKVTGLLRLSRVGRRVGFVCRSIESVGLLGSPVYRSVESVGLSSRSIYKVCRSIGRFRARFVSFRQGS